MERIQAHSAEHQAGRRAAGARGTGRFAGGHIQHPQLAGAAALKARRTPLCTAPADGGAFGSAVPLNRIHLQVV